jgi:hypothetical protein
MANDEIPESDNLVLRHLQAMRKEVRDGFSSVGERFDGVDERLMSVEATLKALTVEFQIAARVTKLEVELAKLKKAAKR